MNNKGLELQKQFEDAVNNLHQHVQYCDCVECKDNRQKLNDLSDEMHKIGYTRTAMF